MAPCTGRGPARRQCPPAHTHRPPSDPSEHALDCHHQVVPERPHGGQEGFRTALQVAREAHLAGRIQDAQVHLAGVQVDAAVVLVLTGIEFHLRPPVRLDSCRNDTPWMVDRPYQARRTWGPHPFCIPLGEHTGSQGPEPRVKGGPSPARAAPLTRGAGRLRWPMAGCGALPHPAMQTQAAPSSTTDHACKGWDTARLLR